MKTMLRALVMGASCFGLWHAPLAAQAASLPDGTRLRVTAPCEDRPASCTIAGEVRRLSGDTAWLDVGGVVTDVALGTTSSVEMSSGFRRHRLAGAGVGFAVAAAFTYPLLGGSSTCDSSADDDAIGGEACLLLMMGGGVVGAGLGTLIGHFVRTERWTEVPVESLRVSVAPGARGRVGMTLSFRPTR
jgi:hypothetical protein